MQHMTANDKTGLLIAQPGQIGSFKLKNRIIMAPMGTNFSTTDGVSTERDKRYYQERAIGGVAMIMTEAMPVSEGARNHHNSMCVFHDRFIPGLASVVEAIKMHDVYVVGQLSHRGGLLRRMVLNMEPVGPSAWRNPNTGDEVRALSREQIKAIQLEFVAAARRMQLAGYDGVEVHAANGYLFHQFFTARINKRTDEYGGSARNRGRFIVETVSRMREAVPDFPVFVRISATEYIPDGYPVEDIVELAVALEQAGVAALDLSGGTNESPEFSRFCIQPPSMPRACLVPFAKPIRDAVSIPVIVAGRIITPADAESVLESQAADFVSLGRALYSDPHWCLKAFGKMSGPIRECISCNVCFERLTVEQDVSCVQNPMLGTEFEAAAFAEPAPAASAGQARRILVIGAGVAGLEAARMAAAQGHVTEVWEAADRPGGQIHLAVAAPDKEEVRPVFQYRMDHLEKLKVPIRCNVRVTAEAVRQFRPDLVVVATGSRPRSLPFDWSRLDAQVARLHAWDVLARPHEVAANCDVVVIGGGMVGIEVADLLITQGCRVTVVEAEKAVALAMARNNRIDILLRLQKAGVRFLLKSKLKSASGTTLTLQGPDGDQDIPAGSLVVTAIGPQSERGVLEELQQAAAEYVLVGDAQQPGDFMSAIRDGFFVGLSLQQRFGHGEPAQAGVPAAA